MDAPPPPTRLDRSGKNNYGEVAHIKSMLRILPGMHRKWGGVVRVAHSLVVVEVVMVLVVCSEISCAAAHLVEQRLA